MGQVTYSVYDIINENKGTNDITTQQGIYNVAKQYLITPDAVNALDSKYRQKFITGFTLHFYTDEIGLETLPLWQVKLSAAIYNNASRINQLYAIDEKALFSEYRTHSGTRDGSTQKSTEQDTSNEEKLDSNATHDSQNDVTRSSENSGQDNTYHSGTSTDNKGINGTITKTGTVDVDNTNSETVTGSRDSATQLSGSDTTDKTASGSTTHTGTTTVDGKRDSSTNTTDNGSTDNNSVDIHYDTPQGSLSNMRSPGGPARGTGVNYPDGQTYNYMTYADEHDASELRKSTTDVTESGTSQDKTTHDTTDADSSTGKDVTEYGKHEESSGSESSEKEGTSKQKTTNDLTDANHSTEASDHSENSNTGHTTKENGTGSENATLHDETGSISTKTSTGTNNGTETGTSSESDAFTDYFLTHDTLMNGRPISEIIFELFDDLFINFYGGITPWTMPIYSGLVP